MNVKTTKIRRVRQLTTQPTSINSSMLLDLLRVFVFVTLILTTLPHVRVSAEVRNVHTSGFDQVASQLMAQSAAALRSTKTKQQPQLSQLTRRREQENSTGFGDDDDDDDSKLFTELNKKTQPIRIHYVTSPIEKAIEENTNSAQKAGGQFVLDTILPEIANNFAEMISVEPLNGIAVDQSVCDAIYSNFIPDDFVVLDVDAIVIVSSFLDVTIRGKTYNWCSTDESKATLAAAVSCGQEENTSRPIIGLMNVCLAATSKESESNMLEILSHELLHVLAISEDLLPFYRNALDGSALTADPYAYQSIPCVNGKSPITFYDFSPNILAYRKESVKYDGRRELRSYYEITLPTVRQVVRNQFNCQSLTGARLENQPTSPASCIGSHFDERFFQYNIMSALYDSTSAHFTPLTLALLEDSGWYKVDYSKATNAPFGLNSGCDFVTKDCIVNDSLPAYSKGNFCNDLTSSLIDRCDPGHNFRGVCDLIDYSNTGYRPSREYFSKTSLGPNTMTHADWCPTVFKYSNRAAECSDTSAEKNNNIEVFGDNSRCMDVSVSGSPSALCISASCDNEANAFIFEVGESSYSCGFGEDGKELQINEKGSSYVFTCPKLVQACPDMFCPSMCSGKGICDWKNKPGPVCKCYNPKDTTAGCFESPPNDPNSSFKRSMLASILVSVVTIFLLF